MIDLAPNHKQGLPVANSVLLAGGAIGYGDIVPRGLELSRIGGVVVGPILYSSRRGASPPRYAETNGGFVLQTGLQNRGLQAVLRRFARKWSRLGCPVIAQIAEGDLEKQGKIAERLAGVSGVSGIELVAARGKMERLAMSGQQVADYSDLPVLVKLPLDVDAGALQPLIDSGAAGFVIGQAMAGTLARSSGVDSNRGLFNDAAAESQEPAYVAGNLYGPLTFGAMLSALIRVAECQYGCTLIACGGIHTVEQAKQALAVGADAIQIDSAVWVEPGLPEWILSRLGV